MKIKIYKNFTDWLLKPYPFPSTLEKRVFITFGFGAFIFLFLFFFKPFGFDKFEEEVLFYAISYSLIVTAVFLINLIVFPFLFNIFFKPSEWNIYKMLLLAIEITVAIGLSLALFTHSAFCDCEQDDLKELTYWFFLKNSFLAGIFPTFFYVYITENIINRRSKIAINIKQNMELSNKILNKEAVSLFIIKGENKNEQFEIDVNDLIYISSEKNYASIFYCQDNKIKEFLLRTSLNSIENQMADYKYVIRCHKSYIVNTNKVIDIQGNARSYQLVVSNINIIIPVSRSFPKELLFTLIKQ